MTTVLQEPDHLQSDQSSNSSDQIQRNSVKIVYFCKEIAVISKGDKKKRIFCYIYNWEWEDVLLFSFELHTCNHKVQSWALFHLIGFRMKDLQEPEGWPLAYLC